MSGGDDLYGLLGVQPTATAGDIADGFARQDLAGDALNAYEILRDPARRRSYDDTRRARLDAAEAAAASHHPATAGSEDVELELSFDQAALGSTATLDLAGTTTCPTCTGAGSVPGAGCTDCGGVGFHTRTSGGINIRTACRSCDGAGHASPSPCGTCHGEGVIETTRAVTIRVPAGVSDGARLRFDVPGGGDGARRHAVVRVAPHPYFTRSGNDLRVRLPLTVAEAALGATVTVPTLDGAVAIRVPPGTPAGRTFRVRGRGIPASSGTGDLLATVDLAIPAVLNDEQRRALEAYGAATPSPRAHFSHPSAPDPEGKEDGPVVR